MAVAIAVAIPGYRFFQFIRDYSVNVLFYDQWDFLGPLFKGNAGIGEYFFYQHGPHREGLGLIVYKFFYPWTAWNARADSFLIGSCIFAAMLLALLLKWKLFGRLTCGDVAIPMSFLTLAQYETLIGTPNVAYSAIPLLLILFYCLALLQRRYLLRYGLCLLLNFFLIYTGFGIFMGIVTVGIFALECYWRLRKASEIPLAPSLGGLVIALASLTSFFIGYTPNPAVACFEFPYHQWSAYPRFVALMVARFFDLRFRFQLALAVGTAGLLFAGGILILLAYEVIKGRRFASLQLTVAVLLTYSVLFAVNTAVGRVCLGLPAAAWPSRYVTLLIPGVLAVYFYLQSVGFATVRKVLIAGFVLLLLPGCLVIPQDARWFTDGKRGWASCYIRTGDISRCEQAANFVIYPYPERSRIKEKLDYLKEHRLNLFADD